MSDVAKNGGITGKGFMPGKSGNPTGRRKVPEEVKEKLSKATPEAVQFWIDTMKDKKADLNMRVRCSENIVDRYLGKAVQSTSLEDAEGNTLIPNITVTFVKPNEP